MRNKLMSTASIAAIAIAAGLGTAVFSPTAIADGYEPAGKGYAPAPVVNRWGGFYLGAHVGAGQANWDSLFSKKSGSSGAKFTVFESLDTDSVLGGVHGGYNWQFGRAVVGVEGNWSYMDWDDTARRLRGSGSTEAYIIGEVDSIADVRLRLGYTVGHDQSVLLFLSGGLAWADASGQICADAKKCPPSSASSASKLENFDFDDVGGVVGAGFEYAMTENFRLRVGGSYYWFDDMNRKTRCVSSCGGSWAKIQTTGLGLDDVVTFRVGGTFYFTQRPRPVAVLK